jgi:hypothetical protein
MLNFFFYKIEKFGVTVTWGCGSVKSCWCDKLAGVGQLYVTLDWFVVLRSLVSKVLVHPSSFFHSLLCILLYWNLSSGLFTHCGYNGWFMAIHSCRDSSWYIFESCTMAIKRQISRDWIALQHLQNKTCLNYCANDGGVTALSWDCVQVIIKHVQIIMDRVWFLGNMRESY